MRLTRGLFGVTRSFEDVSVHELHHIIQETPSPTQLTPFYPYLHLRHQPLRQTQPRPQKYHRTNRKRHPCKNLQPRKTTMIPTHQFSRDRISNQRRNRTRQKQDPRLKSNLSWIRNLRHKCRGNRNDTAAGKAVECGEDNDGSAGLSGDPEGEEEDNDEEVKDEENLRVLEVGH